MVGCLLTVMLSPAAACLPSLVIFWLFGGEALSYDIGMPLILSWASINTLAAFVVPSFVLGREIYLQGNYIKGDASLQEGSEDYDTYESFDETDGPTFLPQQPVPTYYNVPGGFLSEEMKAVIAFTPAVSWKNTIEPSEELHELVRWAVSIPAESLKSSMAVEMLTIAAISIGIPLDGMDGWNQE
jgi:hypothetical protein